MGLGAISVGQHVIAADWVNLRAGAGTNYQLLATFAPDDEPLIVRGGPVHADGLTWWNLERLQQSVWAAEMANGVRLLVLHDPFHMALAFTLRAEGGLSADRNDPGNYRDGVFVGTKWGISAAAYPALDIVNLTQDEAAEIYHRDYWLKSGADTWLHPLSACIFDFAVNAGVSVAQRTLAHSGGDWRRYNELRRKWYWNTDQFAQYGAVWLHRVDQLDEYCA